MPLMLHNTATRSKEALVPAHPGEVRLYACGPTVYDYFHIGNARAFVVFDTLRRVLERRGLRVTYVQNITDIDDKIIRRAQAEGRSAQDVAAEFTRAFVTDLAALNCRPADVTPKATEHIPEILDLVSRLISAKHAYRLGGDVYFSVRSFPAYGRISGKPLDELEEGARVDVDERKRDPLDFALWKAAKPGEPSWPSPWGDGRPGWHIECSAMSMKYLGESFDIHGGGEDLVFPHHENENAQSEAVTGKPLARYWLHNGFLKINGEKMSKSLGNFMIVRELLAALGEPQVLRLFLLSAHYRSPLDFDLENLNAARSGYRELQRTLERLDTVLAFPAAESPDPDAEVFEEGRKQALARFEAFLDDDLNTAGALGQVFSLANGVKRLIAGRTLTLSTRRREVLKLAETDLAGMLEVLGSPVILRERCADDLRLLHAREEARAHKDWARADALRTDLAARGWTVEDTSLGPILSSNLAAGPAGETWERIVRGFSGGSDQAGGRA